MLENCRDLCAGWYERPFDTCEGYGMRDERDKFVEKSPKSRL